MRAPLCEQLTNDKTLSSLRSGQRGASAISPTATRRYATNKSTMECLERLNYCKTTARQKIKYHCSTEVGTKKVSESILCRAFNFLSVLHLLSL